MSCNCGIESQIVLGIGYRTDWGRDNASPTVRSLSRVPSTAGVPHEGPCFIACWYKREAVQAWEQAGIVSCLRRTPRSIAPMPPKPSNSIAHVAGSGTAETTAEMSNVPE